MCGRLAALLLFVATFHAEFLCSNAFNWEASPGDTKIITYPEKKEVTMRWEWSLSGQEGVNQLSINRLNKAKSVATYFNLNKVIKTDDAFFTFKFEAGNTDGKNGFAEFVIKDVTKQGNNDDGTTVDVMKKNYTYTCQIFVVKPDGTSEDVKKETKLVVYQKPSIKLPINDNTRYISSKRAVTLKCDIQAGHPSPSIKWYIPKGSGSNVQYTADSVKIEEFTSTDSGVYNCTAKNAAGTTSAAVVLQYTGCSGCSSDNEIAIEFTSLTYTSQYGNPNSNEYKKTKYSIEKDCLKIYTKEQTKKDYPVYSCVVTGYRKGSVVALLMIKYPAGTNNPRKPLEDAIGTGTFAGATVTKTFVSPTSPPTQSTKPTETTTVESPSDVPDSGARADDKSGLSTGAIIAIVVVFSIIFLVIIVVIVVCMLKRKKPASRNIYKEDGNGKAASSAPLKPQAYGDPLYDNAPDDRFSNGGGPPPQYTAADYAEVRPSQPNQNDSQMEWDKDVDEKNEMWI